MAWTSDAPTRVGARLSAACDRGLTLVTASTGFGKTTALAQLDPDLWLDLSVADRDVTRLASRVATAAGAASTPAVAIGPDDPLAFAEAHAARAAEALSQAGETIVVFDNVDALGRRAPTPSWRYLHTLVAQADPGTHIVLSGQYLPGDLVQHAGGERITEADLTLDVDEIEALLEPGAHSDADVLASLTGGWPAAVRLVTQQLRHDADAVRDRLHANWAAVTAALFAAQSTQDRDILALTAVLGAVDAGLLAAVHEEVSSGQATRLLAALCERGLLVPDGRSGYLRVSPALADVVDEVDDADVVRARAARHFDETGQLRRALDVHLRLGSSSVQEFLRRRGPELIDTHLARSVCDAFDSVPAAGDLELEMLHGCALQATGQVDRAAEVLHHAESRRGDAGLPAAVAWRFASLLYWRGQTEAALRAVADSSAPLTVADSALVAAWRGSCLWALGQPEEAQEATEQALVLAGDAQDARALAAAHCAYGLVCGALRDMSVNQREQRLALAWALAAGDYPQEVRIRANLAACADGLGEYQLAAREIEQAVFAAAGYTTLTAHVLSNRAQILLNLGRVDEARAAFSEALQHFANAAPTMSGAVHLGIAYIDRERGDLVLAQLSARRSLRLSEEIGDAHTASNAQAILACTLALDDPPSARLLAAQACRLAGEQERARALAAAAYVELADHRPDQAIGLLAAAEQAAAAGDDIGELANASALTGLATEPPDIARLESALARWTRLGNVIEALRCQLVLARSKRDIAGQHAVEAELTSRGLAIDVGLSALPLRGVVSKPELRIITLGTFAVVRGREVVPVTEWRSRQARELLQVLIARRGQPIGRQALADLLWPGESGSQIGNRLSVLLSTVRRILDPLREHDPGFAVRAEDNAISLQTDRIHIDVIELLHLVREGIQLIKRRSLDHAETVLRHANQLYRGEFLAENPYADWAVDMRNEALDAAQSALRHLADIAVMRHDDEAAATHLRRLLELDQYDERSWQTLIGCLVRLQRHGEARRQHARYAKLMNELDVTATPMAALTPDP